MFIFALLIGIYSYIIFIFGIAGLLYKDLIIWLTAIFWGIVILFFWAAAKDRLCKNHILKCFDLVQNWHLRRITLFSFFVILFILQALVNLIGVLGPELAFDALWYHLTIPKLYLQNHSIFFIPEGLLYYSAMPKLGEMLYIGGLAFGNEILPKMIHFSFGLLSCLALYKIQRKFFGPLISMIGVVIFYSNLVVAWESITAYVDLIRTFFDVMALWAFINWLDEKNRKWLIRSAIMVGLAITTKLLAVGSLLIFTIIILSSRPSSGKWRDLAPQWLLKKIPRLRSTPLGMTNKAGSWFRKDVVNIFIFTLISFAVPLPWLVFSYVNTDNPVYPFFSEIYKVVPEPFSISGFFGEVWKLFTNSPDPLSPIYMIFLPIIIWYFRQGSICMYGLFSIIIWYFTPRTGGGRFILPYLPAFSIMCSASLSYIIENRKRHGIYFSKFLIIIIIFVSFISIGYRLVANSKYIPVLLGKETRESFLINRLNFTFGDFYDTDGYFKKNIEKEDKVLLIGFHNLYYVDFPFIDSSWLKAGDKFNLIATQNTVLPKKYGDWKLIYVNDKTMVKLYGRE